MADISMNIAAPSIGDAEKEAVLSVLDSGILASNGVVDELEDTFSTYTGVKESVAVSSGTAALQTALRAAGIGENDLVVTTPFSFIATANAILSVGARPVFADIDSDTLNLDPAAVESALRTQEADAILVVHLYGLPCRMDEFAELAEKHGVPLIEDACQAHGAEFDGERVGSLGDAGCFSFYPTKNMTTGEGGMITTSRDDMAERARKFIDHGRSGTYEHDAFGLNYRMTDIQAALGRVQLDRLEEFNDARRTNATELREGLSDVDAVSLPSEPEGCRHVYNQFTVRAERREDLKRFLRRRGIDSRVYYPIPINRQPLYRDLGYGGGTPEAERAANEVLSLPVHPGLDQDDVSIVAGHVSEFYEESQ